jgi:hypothetical protein
LPWQKSRPDPRGALVLAQEIHNITDLPLDRIGLGRRALERAPVVGGQRLQARWLGILKALLDPSDGLLAGLRRNLTTDREIQVAAPAQGRTARRAWPGGVNAGHP